MEKQKFFHASPHRLKIREMIVPAGNYARGKGNGPAVFLSNSSKGVHYTLMMRENVVYPVRFFVFEVRPVGKVWYDSFWDELVTRQPCEVLRLVKDVSFHEAPDFDSDNRIGKAYSWRTMGRCFN